MFFNINFNLELKILVLFNNLYEANPIGMIIFKVLNICPLLILLMRNHINAESEWEVKKRVNNRGQRKQKNQGTPNSNRRKKNQI